MPNWVENKKGCLFFVLNPAPSSSALLWLHVVKKKEAKYNSTMGKYFKNNSVITKTIKGERIQPLSNNKEKNMIIVRGKYSIKVHMN